MPSCIREMPVAVAVACALLREGADVKSSRLRLSWESDLMNHLTLSRRRFLKGTAGGILAAGSGARLAQAANVTIGIVYVGPRDDFGWNQAHAVAIKALKTLPGVKAVEEENVPETDACSKTMESMVNLDGAQ